MIKFTLAARRKPHDTQERYFYEWGIIHVALMLSTPAVMETFRRYVQHYSVNGITDEMLIHPLSDMAWDNFAEHWIEQESDFDIVLYHSDYRIRMQPHMFGDHHFVVEVSDGETVFERPGFASGGIKLINHLKKRPDMSHEQFAAAMRERHAAVVTAATSGFVRKYVQNFHRELDPAMLKGTLFEMGGVGQFSGIEEYWFDSLADLAALRHDPAIHQAITSSESSFVDPDGSFGMVTMERVIYDFTLPAGQRSPRPAVLDPDSLEAAIYRQGLSGWNEVPQP
jgi:EthD domain